MNSAGHFYSIELTLYSFRGNLIHPPPSSTTFTMVRLAAILTVASLLLSHAAASTAAVRVVTSGTAQQEGIPLNYCAFTIDSADLYYGANWTVLRHQ